MAGIGFDVGGRDLSTHRKRSSRIRIAVAALSAGLAVTPSTRAADKTWDGGGANNNFTTPENWDANAAPNFLAGPAGKADDLHFAGSLRTSPINDLAAADQVAFTITFDAGAAGFTVGGNALTLGNTSTAGGDVTNNSSNVQTFTAQVAPRTGSLNAAAGDLVFAGGLFAGFTNVVNQTGRGITVTGPFDTHVAGKLTGGGRLVKNGAGTLFLDSPDNDFTGMLTVHTGVVSARFAHALGSVDQETLVDGGSDTGRLLLAGGADNVTYDAEPLALAGRTAGTNSAPHLVSAPAGAGGHTTWTGRVRLVQGGAQYRIQSDGPGTLDMTGEIVNDTANATERMLYFQGSGDGSVTAPIRNNTGTTGPITVTKQGSGTWTLGGPNEYTGATVVGAGVLRVTGSIAASTGVQVNGGASFVAAARQRVRGLSVDAGGKAVVSAGVLTVGDNVAPLPLTIAPGGVVDVQANGLIVDHVPGAEAATMAATRAQIISGYHASTPGAGDGDWGGDGITSSTAASSPGRAVGYASAGEVLGLSGAATGTFLGQDGVDASSVLVRYTLAGDATLDGVVDFNDLVKLAQNYNTSVLAQTDSWWTRGDFNYDGVVDFNDLVKLAQNYNTALPAPVVPALVDDWARAVAAVAAVPEPVGGVGAALGLLAWATRRRRRMSSARR